MGDQERAVFLSYRRSDSEGYTGRLADWLRVEFGRDRVFLDVSNIEPGADFRAALEGALSASDVLIPVIGPHWLGEQPPGQRRIDREDDEVRQEILGAFNRGMSIMPVLVGGAVMPSAVQLPSALAMLASFQALEVRFTSFEGDVRRLIEAVERLLAEAQVARRNEVRPDVRRWLRRTLGEPAGTAELIFDHWKSR